MSLAVAEVTHNHPEGIKGAEATAVCVFLARQGKSKDEIGAYVRANYYEASCITVGLFDTDSGVKRCEHGARSAECLQRAA